MELSDRQINEIVYKLRVALRNDLKKMLDENRQPELVDINEAADILCISADRLRHIVREDPCRYPHIKRGESRNSRLLFRRDALIR